MPTSFAETHLNRQRSQLIMSYYRGLKFFRDSFTEDDKRRLSYHRIDHLIETYFRTVKDLAHQLFHSSERGTHMRLLQMTFDLSFGIVFHLLLKFKETLRLAENYNIERLGAIVERLQKSSDEEKAEISTLFTSLRAGYERDLAALDDELRRTRDTLDEIEGVFRKIIAVYAGNATIMRTLFANHTFFLKLFPGEGVDHIFKDMYPESGAAEAYVALGFDFVRSGHTALAERAFQHATRRRAAGETGASTDLPALYAAYRQTFLAGAGNDERTARQRRENLESFEAAYRTILGPFAPRSAARTSVMAREAAGVTPPVEAFAG